MQIRPSTSFTSSTPAFTADASRNRILESLPPAERAAIRAVGKAIEFKKGQRVFAAHERFTHVYFPETCAFSLVTDLRDGNSVESGTVGSEGFMGLPVLYGSDSWAQRTIVQVPGRAFEVESKKFMEILPTLPVLSAMLNRFSLAYIAQISQTAACNSQHSIMQRCARWILLTHDRVGAREIQLTQEFLAYMLGVRRPSVTVAQAQLKKSGLISYTRGKMQIMNRKGLEAMSCECHETLRREFSMLDRAAVA